MKLLVAAPTLAPTVLEATYLLTQTVAAPTPADLHSRIKATERLSPTALRPVVAATTLTVAAATAATPTTEPTGELEAAAVAAAEAT
jgi:hypothetical protein